MDPTREEEDLPAPREGTFGNVTIGFMSVSSLGSLSFIEINVQNQKFQGVASSYSVFNGCQDKHSTKIYNIVAQKDVNVVMIDQYIVVIIDPITIGYFQRYLLTNTMTY